MAKGAARPARPTPQSHQTHSHASGLPGWNAAACQSEASNSGTAPNADPRIASLTPRLLSLLDLMAQGRDNAQIAAMLGLSEKTVRNRITALFDKLEVENRSQAIVMGRENGLGKSSS